MVAGVLDTRVQRIAAQCRPDAADGRALDGDMVFDIASLTKLFAVLKHVAWVAPSLIDTIGDCRLMDEGAHD